MKVRLLVHSRNCNERPDSPARTSALTRVFGDDDLKSDETLYSEEKNVTICDLSQQRGADLLSIAELELFHVAMDCVKGAELPICVVTEKKNEAIPSV